jgi:hypothetical protein
MSNIFNRLLDLTCGQLLAISLLINAVLFGAWLIAVLSTASPQAGEIEHKAEHLQQLRIERN